jgi:hypothetical protein
MRQPAHRVSWTLHNGAIPNGLHVLHHCDNPQCVNPAHLWLGTNADNMRDMIRKGRGNVAGGEDHGSAKLTEKQVIEIRERYAAGNITQHELGNEYGISKQTIGEIIRREIWKHI